MLERNVFVGTGDKAFTFEVPAAKYQKGRTLHDRLSEEVIHRLAAAEEKLRDPQIILIALGGLRVEY